MIPTADYASMRKSQAKTLFTKEDQDELDILDELDKVRDVSKTKQSDNCEEYREYLRTRMILTNDEMGSHNTETIEFRFKYIHPGGKIEDISRRASFNTRHLTLERM